MFEIWLYEVVHRQIFELWVIVGYMMFCVYRELNGG